MPSSPATNPLLYDLALQGPPEMFFIGPRRRKLIAPLRGLVLEIGAGTGLSLRYYSEGARVVATEFDPASLPRLSARARSARVGVLFAAADAMRLPFRDATFDALVWAKQYTCGPVCGMVAVSQSRTLPNLCSFA